MKRGAKDDIQLISPEQLKKIEELKKQKGIPFIHIGCQMNFTYHQMSMVKSGKRYLSGEERKKLDEILQSL